MIPSSVVVATLRRSCSVAPRRLSVIVHCPAATVGVTVVALLKRKGKGPVLDVVLLPDEHMMLRSALQSRKWQLIGMS